MKRALALLAIISQLLAVTADARILYVDRANGSDSNDGLAATTGGGHGPLKTNFIALWSLTNADTVKLAPNDTLYDAINTELPYLGQRQHVTFIGDTTWADTVFVPGMTADWVATNAQGIYFTGGVNFDLYDPSSNHDARQSGLRKCILRSGLSVTSSPFLMDSCTVGTEEAECTVRIGGGETMQGDSCVVRGNTMHLRRLGDPGHGHLIDLGGGALSTVKSQKDGVTDSTVADSTRPAAKAWIFTDNAITMTATSGQNFEKIAFLTRMDGAQFLRNTWTWRDSSGLRGRTDQTQALVVRDAMKRTVFRNESYTMHTLLPGTGNMNGLVYSSGSTEYWWMADSLNSWRYCTFKSDVDGFSGAPSFYNQWRQGYRDTFAYNTVVGNTTNAAFWIKDAQDSAFVTNNAFANLGRGYAVRVTPDGCSWTTAGRLYFAGNVIYGNGASGAYQFGYPSTPAGAIYSDYNLIYSTVNGKSGAETCGQCDQAGKIGKVGSCPSYDTHSTFGDPLFADATYATFDPTPTFGSAVAGAGPSGVDAGPIPLPTLPPNAISDLNKVSSADSTIGISFTAPGAHGGAGTATSYTIKYSTSPITAGNFSAATSYAFPPTPRAAGTVERVTITGLIPSTTYYVAVKATNNDTPAKTGGISNVVAGSTAGGGGGLGKISP